MKFKGMVEKTCYVSTLKKNRIKSKYLNKVFYYYNDFTLSCNLPKTKSNNKS